MEIVWSVVTVAAGLWLMWGRSSNETFAWMVRGFGFGLGLLMVFWVLVAAHDIQELIWPDEEVSIQ